MEKGNRRAKICRMTTKVKTCRYWEFQKEKKEMKRRNIWSKNS